METWRGRMEMDVGGGFEIRGFDMRCVEYNRGVLILKMLVMIT
jgi:hypothetical protein